MSFDINEIIEFNPTRKLEKNSVAPFISMAAIQENNKFVKEVELKTFSGGAKFKNGDTLFARITPCLENGKTAMVTILEESQIGHGSTEFIVLSPINESDAEYVYYLSRLPEFRQYAKSRMEGTSGRQRVSWQSLSEFNYTFPAQKIRERVGSFLSLFDSKIELNNQINETLEAMAQAIFKSWFIDFEPVKAKIEAKEAGQDAEGILLAAMSAISGKDSEALQALQTTAPEEYAELKAIAEQFPDSLEESELGLIPKGWEVKPLDEIAEYHNGLALQKFRPDDPNDYLPIVKIAELRSGKANHEEKASPDIRENSIINDGDVIFSWSGTLLVDIWCGGKAALNQHLFKVVSENYPKWFFYFYTKYHLSNFQKIANDKAVTMGHIKRSHLKETLCLIPTSKFLMIDIIDNLLKHKVDNTLSNKTLTELRDTLLPKLLSGKIDVSNVEIDELLENED
ncbi:restriction endonuclease subunit S [Ignatzschineria larvae DSM 13226]|uniref:Restriction endonuclease subunit S n=1 Tax=Ignatzschineria larvae DSM 13226 TaxID=1111732 RepID=A0ABZ3C241_9GAMM|nr:restriction endonuclease subunit S [Ignatzschineria larvae]